MAEGKNKNTSLGIDENVEGLLCYILGFITGLYFLMVEKDNKFVRFHAMQSIATSVFLFIVYIVLSIIPILGWGVLAIIGPVSIAIWLLLMFKAYKGEKFKLPVVGDFSEKQINK